MISVRIAESKKDMDAFVRFGNDLYKDNEYYVPDLEFDLRDMFTPRKNPGLEFSEMVPFLALKDGKVVGRVAGIINHNANKKWDVKNVRFSLIDFIDDPEVSLALLNAVEQWGREKGMTHIQGPMGITDFDKEGMLIEGFDRISSMATYYNYPYYPKHMEMHGYEKEVDWVQVLGIVPNEIPDKYARVSKICTERLGMRIKKINGHDIFKKGYGEKIFNLLNEAYSPIFGYSALSDKQADKFISDYFKLINLDLVTCVENKEGELIAVGITMGSISRALQKSRGRIFPFGWWHLLKSLKFKMEDTVEMLLIGALPEYQNSGVIAMLFTDLIPVYQKMKFTFAETGPILETNTKSLGIWTPLSPTFPKRRRCYQKTL